MNLYFHGALGELNPIADLVLDRSGGLGLATFKVLLICYVIVVMRIAYLKHKVFVRVAVTFCNVVSLVAVVLGCWANTVYYNNALYPNSAPSAIRSATTGSAGGMREGVKGDITE